MAHFAKVDRNIVTKVIVADQEFIDSFIDSEPGEWIQCSYNTHAGIYCEPGTNTPAADQSKALRKNFPCAGFSYDREMDAFIPPKPYDSWVLNETTCQWEPPIARPDDWATTRYIWVEATQEWQAYSEI